MKKKLKAGPFKIRQNRDRAKVADPFKVRLQSKTTTIRYRSAVYEPPKNPKEIGVLVARARSIRQQLDEVKPLYNELDQITLALMNAQEALRRHGKQFGVELVDNFAEKNTAFRVAAIRRFELKWTM